MARNIVIKNKQSEIKLIRLKFFTLIPFFKNPELTEEESWTQNEMAIVLRKFQKYLKSRNLLFTKIFNVTRIQLV